MASPMTGTGRVIRRYLPAAALFVALLVAWQGAVTVFQLREYLLPAPLRVVQAMTGDEIPWLRHLSPVSGVTSSARAERDRRGAVEAVAEVDEVEDIAGPVAIEEGAQVGERLQAGVVQAHEHVARLQAGPLGAAPGHDRAEAHAVPPGPQVGPDPEERAARAARTTGAPRALRGPPARS